MPSYYYRLYFSKWQSHKGVWQLASKGGFCDIPTTTQWFSFASLPSFMFSATDLYSKQSFFFILFYEIDFMATSSKVQFVI